MDFLKALEKAREQGITKEEFMPIWQDEAKTKLKTEEAKILQLQLAGQVAATNNNYLKESNSEDMITQQTQELLKLSDDMNQFLEQQKQYNQQLSDLRDEVTKLPNFLSSQVVQGVKSLKPWLMQVVEKKLERSGKVHTNKARTSYYSSGASCDIKIEDTQEALVHTIDSVDDFIFQEALYKPGEQNESTGFHGAHYLEDFDGSNDWNIVGQKGKPIKQECPVGPLLNFKRLNTDGNLANYCTQSTDFQELRFEPNGTELLFIEGGTSGDLKNKSKSARLGIIPKSPSIEYIPDEGAEFFIPQIKHFHTSNQDFFTKTMYTRPKACQVRLKLWFNKGGRLGVRLLVSEGAFDENHKWPLVIRGLGYIFNQTSLKYTQLWVIDSQKCHKPEKNKEIILGASVCLSSSRDPRYNVTHDLLMKKGYAADGDRLLLKWHLKAEEMIDRFGDVEDTIPK